MRKPREAIIPGPYHHVRDLPTRIAVFPLRRVILLPRVNLPLNIFEPRYLAMIDDALAGDRLIGIVQPARGPESVDNSESPSSNSAPLRNVGTVGRLTAFSETDDGRYVISLSGLARFRLQDDVDDGSPYRVCNVRYDFPDDLDAGGGDGGIDREHLLTVLKTYLDANDLEADWDAINDSSNEFLVNTLAMLSPYGSEEKQALLEASDLAARARVLIALAQMEIAAPGGGSDPTLQ